MFVRLSNCPRAGGMRVNLFRRASPCLALLPFQAPSEARYKYESGRVCSRCVSSLPLSPGLSVLSKAMDSHPRLPSFVSLPRKRQNGASTQLAGKAPISHPNHPFPPSPSFAPQILLFTSRRSKKSFARTYIYNERRKKLDGKTKKGV